MLSEAEAHPYTSVVIVAAGKSTRMSGEDKIMALISGNPLIYYSINAFENAKTVDEIIIVTRRDLIKKMSDIIKSFKFKKISDIICGGESRAQSAVLGFENVSDKCEFISIHDGARPLIKSEEIDFVHQEAYINKAVCCSVKVKDTIKKIDLNGKIVSTLNRNYLVAAATPQVFERNIYENAVKKAGDNLSAYTDDSGIVENFGYPVKAIFCGCQNIKITTEEDLNLARIIIDLNKK